MPLLMLGHLRIRFPVKHGPGCSSQTVCAAPVLSGMRLLEEGLTSRS